jgi:hypothetical protein
MKNSLIALLILPAFLAAAACASGGATPIRFMHGQKVPDQFISISESSPESVTFRIRVDFTQKKLYHILLDEEQTRLAEDWYQTVRIGQNAYTVQMTLKPGKTLQPGVRYRLCIGEENPDLVGRHFSSYKCMADYEFVLPQK